MNILFVPLSGGSNDFTMYVLYKRYFSQMEDVNCGFLLPKSLHQLYKDQNVPVLDLDYTIPVFAENDFDVKGIYNLFKKEEELFKHFYPDIVIECQSINTFYLCEKYKIPRISIQSTGIFRNSNPETRNPLYIHSLDKSTSLSINNKIIQFKEISKLNLTFNDLSNEDFFLAKYKHGENEIKGILNSKSKFIPGIPSIEKLPAIKNRDSFFYCGPLYVNDNPSDNLKKQINDFFEKNSSCSKVFITTGKIEESETKEIIILLLKKGYAVLTTIPQEDDLMKSGKIFFNSVLPLNFICSMVDLVIHHCESSIYHYPLLNLKPVITLGTQCYDREEVALQLEALGLSAHIPSPIDDADYLEKFMTNLEKFENGKLCDFDKLASIKEEIIETMRSFDIEKVLEYTLED